MKPWNKRKKNSVEERRNRRSNIRKKPVKSTASSGKSSIPNEAISQNGRSTKDTFSRGNGKKPFEYEKSVESEGNEVEFTQMKPRFSHKPKSKTKKKTKKGGRKTDQMAELIDMITECVNKKGKFEVEDLTPEQLKLFQSSHKMVSKMNKMGIPVPEVNILEETSQKKVDKLQKYPGNNKLDEKYDRKNRYGTFDSKWDKMIDLYYNDPLYKKPKVNNFHIEPYNEKFQDVEEQAMGYINLEKEKARVSAQPQLNQRIKVEEYEEDYTDEHLRVESDIKLPKPERKLLFSEKADPKKKNIPGVVNSQKRVDEVRFMHVKRRADAALMIQKWYRGYMGRKKFKKKLQKKNIRDEEDYGYFEVSEQGVRQFLKDRKQK